MASARIDSRRNWLLKHLPDADRDVLVRHLWLRDYPRGAVLCEQGEELRHAYFPVSSVLSVVIVMSDGRNAETATVGCEGVAGIEGLFAAEGVRATAQIRVQIGGGVIVGATAPLRRAAREHPLFRQLLQRYLQAFLQQALQSAGCNKLHDLTQRLCRWLLMLHDRVGGDSIAITHEVLAEMLGVRRATVSDAANRLQRAGAIRLERGAVTVLRRDLLLAAACECYGATHATYERALRSTPWPAALQAASV